MLRISPALRMLSSQGWCSAGLVLLVAGLLVGGCNVFGGSVSGPDTVDALLDDAQTALSTGDPSRAVGLLEQAFDEDSTDVRVRVELGNALYAERGLDVFTLRAAAEHLVESSDSSGASTAEWSSQGENVCTDEAQPEAVPDRYDSVPRDADPLRRLVDRSSVVGRVQRLVVRGVLERRPDAFSSARRRVRQKGLLIGAITAVAKGVIDVHGVFETTDGSLYLDRGAEPHRALVACAGAEGPLGQNHEALCALGAAARQGMQWLQDRDPALEEDQGSLLIERLQDLAAAASARVDCS